MKGNFFCITGQSCFQKYFSENDGHTVRSVCVLGAKAFGRCLTLKKVESKTTFFRVRQKEPLVITTGGSLKLCIIKQNQRRFYIGGSSSHFT